MYTYLYIYIYIHIYIHICAVVLLSFLLQIAMHTVQQFQFIFCLAGQSWVLLLSSRSQLSFPSGHGQRIGRPLDKQPSCSTTSAPICFEHF